MYLETKSHLNHSQHIYHSSHTGLSRPLLNVYPLDLGATEAQQTTIAAIATLPCTFKILFGFMSDQLPMFGYRRKGYMWIGWSISAIIMVVLLMTCNLSMDWNSDGSVIIPEDAPSIQQLSLAFLIFGTGFWLADVMGDSIVVGSCCESVFCLFVRWVWESIDTLHGAACVTFSHWAVLNVCGLFAMPATHPNIPQLLSCVYGQAERAKLEPSSSRGQLQSTCYAYRFFGMMVAAPVSTLLYDSNYGPQSIVLAMAIIPPLIMGPLMYLLEEIPATRVLSAKEQCSEIWTAVCSRAVWQPMGFVSEWDCDCDAVWFGKHALQPSYSQPCITGLSIQHSACTQCCLATISKDCLGIYCRSVECPFDCRLHTVVHWNTRLQVLLYSI